MRGLTARSLRTWNDWGSNTETLRPLIETSGRIWKQLNMTTVTTGVEQEGDWIKCQLSEVCSAITYGLTASASEDPTGPKFLRITDIVSGDVNWEEVPFVSADAATLKKYKLYDGDIVIARTGASTGASTYIKDPPPSVFASYLVRLQTKPEFDSRFVSYYLKSDEFWTFIRGVLGDKSAQPNASASTMASAPFMAPKLLSEQRAIAHVLGTLDDKIELNRRMNWTLEEMARAIFKGWFVDFGPTRAKMEGQEPYLPQELWNLFPDQVVDSELGEIPEGWEVRALSTYSFLNPESWTKKNLPESLEYVDLANTKWGIIESTQVFSQEDIPSRARRILRSDDTIIGTVRPGNGSYTLVGRKGLTGSTGFAVLRPLKKELRELVYLAATAPDNIERLTNRADGAAYPAVRPEVVVETVVVGPVDDTDLLDLFSKATRPLLNKIERNQVEIRTLASLRNRLLPSLISGRSSPER